MRLLYINDVLIDIDDKTAIGIDLQTYDIKNPAVRKIKISNEFTIPITNSNLEAIGYLGDVQNDEANIYNKSTCSYYINNIQYIDNSRVRITEISDRITCYIYDKPDIWDELKKVTWLSFVQDYFTWLNVPKLGSEGAAVLPEFILPYTLEGGDSGLFLPITICNKFSGGDEIWLSLEYADTQPTESGGAMMSFVVDVFKFIEDTYGINFYTSELFTGNIWADEIAAGMYWNYRHIYPRFSDGGYYFDLIDDSEPIKYMNDWEVQETNDKTLYDFVISFIQQFNILVRPVDDGFKLTRFDDLTQMPVVDFSGNLSGTKKFKPFIEGYGQSTNIKFETIEEGISPETNTRVLTCLNENIDVSKDLFKINAYMPSVSDSNGFYDVQVPFTNTQISFNNFKFFVNNGQISEDITLKVNYKGAVLNATISDMFYASVYSLNGEYTLIDSALNYPKYYEFNKWLTSTELHEFDFFKQYFIRELGGSFFINKISGFNPELSKQAVTLEVFKVSDQTPDSSFTVLDAYTDGVENPYKDSVGNYYI